MTTCFSCNNIMQNGMNNNIGVSVYCMTFNHDKYIRKTLEGFINQKVNFPTQFIIHDDASTDDTKNIILEYKKKYPNLLDVIFQDENQYSQGIKIFNTFITPRIKYKYIACCEGDDYWTNEKKLQLQFDYMEGHPECSLCVHNTQIINENDTPTQRFFNTSKVSIDYDTNDIIMAKGGGLFHTSSFFYRTDDRFSMPLVYKLKGIGDYPLSIYLSTLGEVHYLPMVMSMYRTGSINSWVKLNMTGRKGIAFNERLILWLDDINFYTNYKYDKAIRYSKNSYKLDNLILEKNYKEIKNQKELYSIFKEKPINTRALFVLSCLKSCVIKLA